MVVSVLAGLLFTGCERNHKPSSNRDTGISAVVGDGGRGGIGTAGDVEEPYKPGNNEAGIKGVSGTGGAGAATDDGYESTTSRNGERDASAGADSTEGIERRRMVAKIPRMLRLDVTEA